MNTNTNTNTDMKDEIMLSAQKLLHYNNLLIRQCDTWLPEKEGNRNMMRKIMERENTPYLADMQANCCQAGMTAHQISRKMQSERKKNSFTGKMADLIYSFRRRKN